MTWASGETFCQSEGFAVYLESLKVIGGDTDFFVFTHDMPEDVKKQLDDRCISVVSVDPGEIHFLIRDRNLAYWKFLVENQHRYKYCVITDCKDVVFQVDPIPLLPNLTPEVILVSEGMTHSQSGWNMIDQLEAQANVREFRTEMRDKPVVNGGVFLGTSRGLKNLCFLIWSNAIRSMGRCTEQGVLNHLCEWLRRDSDYMIVTDRQIEALCLTGEAMKTGIVRADFKEGQFLHENGQPYMIVHQWERTIHKAEVLSHYLK